MIEAVLTHMVTTTTDFTEFIEPHWVTISIVGTLLLTFLLGIFHQVSTLDRSINRYYDVISDHQTALLVITIVGSSVIWLFPFVAITLAWGSILSFPFILSTVIVKQIKLHRRKKALIPEAIAREI